MASTERAIPAPIYTAETAPFWEAAKQGKFLLTWCKDTNKAFWYPRGVSPFTLSNNVEWREASGRGTIYSVSVMKRAPQVYAIAYVTLDEGPTIMTNIVDCDFDKLAIGQKVKLVWKPTQDDGPPYPMFTPA